MLDNRFRCSDDLSECRYGKEKGSGVSRVSLPSTAHDWSHDGDFQLSVWLEGEESSRPVPAKLKADTGKISYAFGAEVVAQLRLLLDMFMTGPLYFDEEAVSFEADEVQTRDDHGC